MIQLLGIRKDISVEKREKLAITASNIEKALKILSNIVEEIIILSTCNRTEIYFNSSEEDEEILNKIFECIGWDLKYREYFFYSKDEDVIKHLMEVVSGFHSKILGEDQILGQIKNAYTTAIMCDSINGDLERLFQEAISCGKKFRTESKLYEIPVSSASIAVSKAMEAKAKTYMIIGYGEVGALALKYLLQHEIEKVIVVVRDNKKKIDIIDERIIKLNYNQAKEVLNTVDCIISCTSAPHVIIHKDDFDSFGKKVTLFDLALPRDIDENVKEYDRITLYDIDDISKLDDINKELRKRKMEENKYIIEKYIFDYLQWKSLRQIKSSIVEIKEAGDKVAKDRIKTLVNKSKSKEDLKLGEILIQSTADTFTNRAIQVLKEESLKGSESECLEILKRIFIQ